jgi:hypothetical protein
MDEPTPCRHCDGKGTCNTADGKKSCEVCIAYWRIRLFLSFRKADGLDGLVCSSCRGKGSFEPHGRARWDYRFPAYLAGGLSVLSFGLLWITYGGGEAFNKTLVFVGTLLGSVTGYYFGRERSTPSVRNKPTKSENPASLPEAQSQSDPGQ